MIVATGPSIEGVQIPPLPDVYIIAVNCAIEWLLHADAFFTMDPDKYMVPLLKDQRPGVRYYLALPDDHPMRPIPGLINLRRIMGNGPRGTCYKLAEDTREIHAGNSCYGALNVAYHMRPKRVAIVGLDGTDIGHAYEPKRNPGWSLAHLPILFATAGKQLENRSIEVVNGSKYSRVRCFHRTTPQDALAWIANEVV